MYALCSVLYESLTGEIAHVLDPNSPPSPRDKRPEVSQKLADVVRVGLGDQNRRYPDADALVAGLREAAKSRDKRSEAAVPAHKRRKSPRAAYVAPTRIVRANGQRVDGRSEDISEGGMLIIAGHALDDRERVQVRFALPSSGAVVTVTAEARWIEPHARARRHWRAVHEPRPQLGRRHSPLRRLLQPVATDR